MFMIVVFHIVYHCVNVQLTDSGSINRMGNGLFNHPLFYKKLFLLNAIAPWGPISNAVFLLLSGYFMVLKGKSIDLVKVSKKLLFQLGFAVLVLGAVSNAVFQIRKSGSYISMESLMNFNYTSWYIGYYFFVILIGAVALNEYLQKLEQRNYSVFLITEFSLTQFSWSAGLLNGIGNGLNLLLTGIFLYSFGGYVRMFDPFKKIRIVAFFAVIAVLYVMIYISSYNVTMTNIELFERDNPGGIFKQGLIWHDNSSFLVLAVAICMFEIFKRIRIPNCRIINFIGASTFMVYLIHDNRFFYSLWGLKDWIVDLIKRPWFFLVDLTVWGGATFVAGVLCYVAYLAFMKILGKMKRIVVKA